MRRIDCGSDCVGPDCEGCRNFKPISSHAVLAEVAPRKGFNAGRVVLHCGNCNSTNIRLNIDSCNQKHFKYCPDCGSKVDWRNFI